uniref:Uncharacterized protein n=1 Tax=Meloidogyne enterolobii TaxID=390850 RepID=A0A6V7WR25_MELEN|nr:unnamed protein product [Meloidogyne enterolobii]
MKEDISSDSDYELIQSNTNLRQGNENENKDVLPENQINVEELKQTFQQMIDELKIENSKQNSVLKEIIEQKDEKIICLENKIKQVILALFARLCRARGCVFRVQVLDPRRSS